MPRAAQQIANGSFLLALGVALVVGVLLGRSSFVSAQSLGQGTDPTLFPATGYRISSPAIYDYFQQRGGVRTFGFPVSNDFPLLGHRIQIFQRQVLELRADGTVTTVNVLEPDVLPIQNFDGLILPAVDLELLANSPTPDSPDYAEQGLAFVNAYVPDEWEGMQVNYLSTFLTTVSCEDAFGADPDACDASLLPVYALEIWGLPTSLPTPDPVNPEVVYQRFQRGILHYSQVTGLTRGLLVGDWFKRVLIGLNLSPDIAADVRGSRFFGQYAPTRPLGLSRPTELPDTSLAQAFLSETLSTAAQQGATLPPAVAQTATAVAMTATALTGTQVVLESTAISLTSTALSLTVSPTTPVPLTPATPLMPAASPIGVVSDIPVSTAGCLGDEQMWFVPRRPSVGTRAEISVTSQRHHDLRVVRLAGPVDAGVTPTERLSVFGFTWTWSVVPAVEAFHEWTFFADGLRPCITSGFNAFPPLGATATPTTTSEPTNTPGPTTPTATPLPAVPFVSRVNPAAGNCGQSVQIIGTNFGNSVSDVTGRVFFNGPSGQESDNILSWTNTTILARVPTALLVNQDYEVIVAHAGGSSSQPVIYRTEPGTTCSTPERASALLLGPATSTPTVLARP